MIPLSSSAGFEPLIMCVVNAPITSPPCLNSQQTPLALSNSRQSQPISSTAVLGVHLLVRPPPSLEHRRSSSCLRYQEARLFLPLGKMAFLNCNLASLDSICKLC